MIKKSTVLILLSLFAVNMVHADKLGKPVLEDKRREQLPAKSGMVQGDELDGSVLKDEWRELVISEINWDYPGLESAKKRFLAGDKKGASAEFVKYLRN